MTVFTAIHLLLLSCNNKDGMFWITFHFPSSSFLLCCMPCKTEIYRWAPYLQSPIGLSQREAQTMNCRRRRMSRCFSPPAPCPPPPPAAVLSLQPQPVMWWFSVCEQLPSHFIPAFSPRLFRLDRSDSFELWALPWFNSTSLNSLLLTLVMTTIFCRSPWLWESWPPDILSEHTLETGERDRIARVFLEGRERLPDRETDLGALQSAVASLSLKHSWQHGAKVRGRVRLALSYQSNNTVYQDVRRDSYSWLPWGNVTKENVIFKVLI